MTAPEDVQHGDGQVAYRPAQAAKRMGISRSQLYLEMRGGRIKAHKLGSATLIAATEIDRWLAELPEWQPDDQ